MLASRPLLYIDKSKINSKIPLLWNSLTRQVFHQDSHRSSLRSELENSLMSPLPRPPNKKGKNTHIKMLKTRLQMSAPDQDFSPALMGFFFLRELYFYAIPETLSPVSKSYLCRVQQQQQYSSF